jgi:hypothetical protein
VTISSGWYRRVVRTRGHREGTIIALVVSFNSKNAANVPWFVLVGEVAAVGLTAITWQQSRGSS